MERSGSLLVKMVPNNLAEVYYKLHHQNQDFYSEIYKETPYILLIEYIIGAQITHA